MELIFSLHSWLRWIVVALLMLGLIANLSGWLGTRVHGAIDRALNGGVLGAMGLQLLLGLVLLVFRRHDGQAFEHGTTMLLAVGLAHLSLRWRALGDAARFKKAAVLHAVLLGLVYLGVWRITGDAAWPLALVA